MQMIEKTGLLIGQEGDVLTIWTLEDGETNDYHTWKGTHRICGIPPDIGDIVKIGRDEITKEPNPMLQVRHVPAEDGDRERFQAKVCFVPLNFSLYPKRAKEKNLVLAFCRELNWYIPIVVRNDYGKHQIYIGEAYFYPKYARTTNEQRICEIYKTDWLMYADAQLASEEFVRNTCTFHTGVVLDSLLADVFMVYNEEAGIVSLRKELCKGKGIAVGSWIEFIYLDVKEGEKADETRETLPNEHDENWTQFERRVALYPIKVREQPYPTRAISEKQIQIIHEFEVPVNPTHAAAYKLPLLGTFTDEKGLVGVKNEASVLRVKICSRTSNHFRMVNFYLEEIIEHQQKLPPELPTPSPPRQSFIESIDRPRTQRRVGNTRSRSRAPMSSINSNSNRATLPIQPAQEHQEEPASHLQATQQPTVVQQQQQEVQSEQPPKGTPPKDHTTFMGIVVERHENYVLAFAHDSTLTEKIARLTRNEISPLPEVGQWVKIIMEMRFYARRRPDYIVWRAERTSPVFQTHVGENGIVLVRAPLNVKRDIDGNYYFYVKDLGDVSNDEENPLPIKAGYNRVWAWCMKIWPDTHSRIDPWNRIHWKIGPVPDEEWIEKTPAAPKRKFVPIIQTTMGYVGARYRKDREKEKKEAPKEEIVYVRTSARSTNVAYIQEAEPAIPPDSNSTESQDLVPDPDFDVAPTTALDLTPSSSGTSRSKSSSPMEVSAASNDNNKNDINNANPMRKQPSPPTFHELLEAQKIDLIDLNTELPAVPEPEQHSMEEDKSGSSHHFASNTAPIPKLASIQTTTRHYPAPKSVLASKPVSAPILRNPVQPALPEPILVEDAHDQEFSFMGVVASTNYKIGGYYVFCRELYPREVYMGPVGDSINLGTWIRFNLMDIPRLTVSHYAEMDSSPYFIKTERNTIIMFVKSTIPDNFDASQPLTTEYVPTVYDINHMIHPTHWGQTCCLKVKRNRRPGGPTNWEVVGVMELSS